MLLLSSLYFISIFSIYEYSNSATCSEKTGILWFSFSDLYAKNHSYENRRDYHKCWKSWDDSAIISRILKYCQEESQPKVKFTRFLSVK